MSSHKLLRALLTTSSLCGAIAASPALAQTIPFRNLDANGVDLTQGDFFMNFEEGSIGSGAAKLSLVRQAVDDRPTAWDRISYRKTKVGTTTTVYIGLPDGTTEKFVNGVSTKSDGGALYTFNYVARDGTSIVFVDPVGADAGPNNFCVSPHTPSACTMYPGSITYPGGHKVTFQYTSYTYPGPSPNTYNYDVRLNNVKNNFGYQITFFYSNTARNGSAPAPSSWFQRTSAGFRNTVTATSIGMVQYAYPTSGTVAITDLAGNVWEVTATSIKRPGESTPSFTVGGSTLSVTSVTRDGVTTMYNRNATTGTMVVTDPLGNATTTTNNMTIGRPTSVKNAKNQMTSYTYDTYGRLTQVTQPEGNYTAYVLDGRGNATQIKVGGKTGAATPELVTNVAYDATCSNVLTCNQPNSVTSPTGNVTNYTYDASSGQVTSVKRPAPTTGATRPETRYSYTLTGGIYLLTGVSECQVGAAPSCVGTADEVKTTVAYDSNGNVSSVSKGAGNGSLTATTAYTYSAAGDVLTADGPLAGNDDMTTWRYDAARRQVGAIAPDPDGAGARKRAAVRTTYDTAGRVTSVEDGVVASTTDTDWSAFASADQVTTTWSNGRKSKDVVTAGGTTYQVTQYGYDAGGRSLCTALRMNSATWTSLPSDACTLGVTGSFGPDRITKVHYDELGRVDKTTSAVGTAHPIDDAIATFSNNGQVATLTDGKGNRTTYEYDRFDRLTKTRYPSPSSPGTSSTTDYDELVYDGESRASSHRLRGYASDSTQHIDYGYDALNRVTSKDLPGSEPDVAYSYDLLDRITGASSSAQSLTFGYDALSRMTSQGGPLGTMASQYDLAGQRTRLTWPDAFYATYDYDSAGYTTYVRENGAASGIGVLARFGYDDLGNRTSLTRGNGTVTSYTPDGLSRLSSLTQNLAGTANDVTATLGYNPASQTASMTRSNDGYAYGSFANASKSHAANGLDQVTNAGGTAIGYDARGNTTSIGSASYTYSSENLLLTGPNSASLIYDPLLRLYQTGTTEAAATRFQYDLLALTGEYDSGSTLQHRYVHGSGVDEPLMCYDRSGSTYARAWLLADERGSIVATSDDTGARTSLTGYDEYGIPAGTVSRFGYTGQIWVPELSLWYYKARMYAPSLGRFMQTDPIGYADGLNWYAYASADAVNRSDPSGLKCFPGYVQTGPRTWKWTPCATSEPDDDMSFGLDGAFGFGGIATSLSTWLNGGGGGSSANDAAEPVTCTPSSSSQFSAVIDRVGDAHGSVFAAGSATATGADEAARAANAAKIGRAGLPGAVVLSGASELAGYSQDRAGGMSKERAAAIHGGSFVGSMSLSFLLGEAVEPLGGGVVSAIIAGIGGGYFGGKAGSALGTSGANAAGFCR